MRVIKEETESLGFTVDNLSAGIYNDFGFKGTNLNEDSLEIKITNDSKIEVTFDVDEFGIIIAVKSAEFELPRDISKIDLMKDLSEIEELSAMLISATEVMSYIREKVSK